MRGRWLGMLAFGAVLSLLLAGCVPTSPSASVPDPRLWGNWQLVSATDSHGTFESGQSYISLRVGKSSDGISTCGRYRASVTGVGDTGVIFVAVPAPRANRCGTDKTGDEERRYLSALRRATRAVVQTTPATAKTPSNAATPAVTTLRLTAGTTRLVYSRAELPPLYGLMGVTWVLTEFPADPQTLDQLGKRLQRVTLTFETSDTFRVISACGDFVYDFSVRHGRMIVPGASGTGNGRECTSALDAFDLALGTTLMDSLAVRKVGTSLTLTPVDSDIASAVFDASTPGAVS